MTIKNKKKFEECPAAGFDGYFDWDWTKGCLGVSHITPTDIDGLTERKGNFLIFETKTKGNHIPKGQFMALEALYNIGCFTVVFCDKLNPPTQMSVWTAPGFKSETGKKMKCEKILVDGKVMYSPTYIDIANNKERARNFILNWYDFADGVIFIPDSEMNKPF